MKVVVLSIALLLALAPSGDASAISQMWMFGGSFPTLSACVGDTLSFVYESTHNVFSLDNGNCDFSNGLQVGPTNSGITVTVTLNATGTFHYACEIPGHCQGGNMNLEVDVAACGPPPAASVIPAVPVSSAPPPIVAVVPAAAPAASPTVAVVPSAAPNPLAAGPVTVSAPSPSVTAASGPSPSASSTPGTPAASPASTPSATTAATPSATTAATPSTSASTPSSSPSTAAATAPTTAPAPAPSGALRAAASAAPLIAGVAAAATLLVSLI